MSVAEPSRVENGYFIVVDGQRRGPFAVAQLQGMSFTAATLVWRRGMSQWTAAEQVEELRDLLRQSPPATPPSLTPADPASSVQKETVETILIPSEVPPELPPAPPQQHGPAPIPNATSPSSIAQAARLGIDSVRKNGRRMWDDFQQVDLRREVWPLDKATASRLASDPSFWSILLLASLPLFFLQFQNQQHAVLAFALFFAVIWGVIYRFAVLRDVTLPLRWMIGVFLFTGLIGIWLVGLIGKILPGWDLSTNAGLRLIGCIGENGLLEEAIKAIPVVLALAIFGTKRRYSDVVMIGIASGLGFAAFENLLYFHLAGQVGASETFTGEEVNAIVAQSSQLAIVRALSRSMATPFAHAALSGIVAHFAFVGFSAGRKRLPLWFYGYALAACMHGFYNWLITIQGMLSVLVAVLAFMLFRIYLVQGTTSAAGQIAETAPDLRGTNENT